MSEAPELPGVIPSPNIWGDPEAYEIENRGTDPEGAIEAAMRSVRDWAGLHVLDVGCGSGYHLPVLAAAAGRVTGVEPHPQLVRQATDRVAGLANVRVLSGSAEALPLPPSSVDVVQARWAYFFGPGCEAGLAELDRVLRPGGTAFVIDTDATRSKFGQWFRAALPDYDATAVERFWARRGWSRIRVTIRWDFPDRASFQRVLAIEFPPQVAAQALAQEPGTGVDYAVNVFHRTFG